MQFMVLIRRMGERMVQCLPKMSSALFLLFGILAVVSGPAFCAAPAEPELLKVRLETHLTSYASKPGSEFRAVVTANYERNGRILIPRGSFVYGTVRRAISVGLGIRHERARLSLSFNAYQTPDGQRVPIKAKLVSIENARERVLPNGDIRGVLAAQNPNGLLSGFWYNPASDLFLFHSAIGLTGVAHQLFEAFSMGTPAAAGLLAARCIIFRFPEPEIHFPPGTDMRLAVTFPPGPLPSFPSPPPVEVPQVLAQQLDTLTREITRHNGRPAEDLINVVFLGSRQELTDAFSAAGWSSPERRSALSYSHEYRAFSSMRGYTNAPVSRLFYRGDLPDLIFQKSLNTVTKRDHIRIWYYGIIDGQDVWLGAATHDSGITFRASGFAFSHKIDSALDVERATVTDDLSFAGCSESPSYLRDSSELPVIRGDSVTTDGRLAVVSIKICDGPSAQSDSQPGPPPPGNKLTRITRRFILESRNYLLRENAYYWTYELIRYHRISSQ